MPAKPKATATQPRREIKTRASATERQLSEPLLSISQARGLNSRLDAAIIRAGLTRQQLKAISFWLRMSHYSPDRIIAQEAGVSADLVTAAKKKLMAKLSPEDRKLVFPRKRGFSSLSLKSGKACRRERAGCSDKDKAAS